MARALPRICSLGAICVTPIIAALADQPTPLSSRTTSAEPFGTKLNFVVPEPVQAPGVNTSSGCGKELDLGLEAGGPAAGPFNFDTSDGYGRNYTIHVPRSYDINKASPLIFGLPGKSGTDRDIEKQTQLSDESINPHAIVIYVSGYNLGFVSSPGYGDTEGATYPKVDDLSFINSFIDDLTDRFCIDTGRIWAVGHSNGGGLTNVMACDPVLSTRITAFAANSGAFYTNYTHGNPDTVDTGTAVQRECSPGHMPVPYIEFHGTKDDVISYEGTDNHSSYGIRVLPDIQHWASNWAVRNGFSADNVVSQPEDDVTVYRWGDEDNLGVVTHYRLRGWIHDYAQKPAGAPIDATPIILQFFYNQTNFATTSTSTSTALTSSGTPSGTSMPSSTSGEAPTSTSIPTSTPSVAAAKATPKTGYRILCLLQLTLCLTISAVLPLH